MNISSENDYILEMKNVVKKFPGVVALKNVSMQLKKSEILGICGENGAGKSTLIKILCGSYPYGTYEGEILIGGKSVKFNNIKESQNMGIEMIAQEINMVLSLSVAENMFLGNLPGEHDFVDYKKLYSDTKNILNLVNIDVDPREPAAHLNSGQLQMVALMRAYIKKPKILILDEPTSSLTTNEVDQLMSILDQLRDHGTSCIYISHKLEEIYRICDRVMVLRDGEAISCRNIRDVEQNTLVEEMVGRKVENLYPKINVDIGEEVLRVENLTVPHPFIKNRNIVENVSFSLKKRRNIRYRRFGRCRQK